jgi:hypothetical protein
MSTNNEQLLGSSTRGRVLEPNEQMQSSFIGLQEQNAAIANGVQEINEAIQRNLGGSNSERASGSTGQSSSNAGRIIAAQAIGSSIGTITASIIQAENTVRQAQHQNTMQNITTSGASNRSFQNMSVLNLQAPLPRTDSNFNEHAIRNMFTPCHKDNNMATNFNDLPENAQIQIMYDIVRGDLTDDKFIHVSPSLKAGLSENPRLKQIAVGEYEHLKKVFSLNEENRDLWKHFVEVDKLQLQAAPILTFWSILLRDMDGLPQLVFAATVRQVINQ